MNKHCARQKSAQNKKRIKSNPIWFFVCFFPCYLIIRFYLLFSLNGAIAVDGSVYFLRYAFIHLMKSNGFQYFSIFDKAVNIQLAFKFLMLLAVFYFGCCCLLLLWISVTRSLVCKCIGISFAVNIHCFFPVQT